MPKVFNTQAKIFGILFKPMRKLAFSLMLFLGCAFGAHADVLYWMIDDSSLEDTFKDWSYATLTANPTTGEGSAIQLGWPDASGYKYNKGDGAYGFTSDFGSIVSPENFTYLVELWNADDSKLAQAKTPYSYAQIQSSLESAAMTPGQMLSLGGGAFGAVPEPTSGLLFLMGGVLLGLRRRRMA